MKNKVISLGIMVLMSAGLALGQACKELGVDCSHPISERGDPGGRNIPQQQQEAREAPQSEQVAWKAVEAERTWKKTGDRYYFNVAVEGYERALQFDSEYAPAYVGLVDMYEGGRDHRRRGSTRKRL